MIRISTLLAMLMLVLSTNAFAQSSTTAAINGLVTDATNGDKLSGATVKLVHIPTGTKYGIKANASGRYNLIGLKVGGPYTFTVSYVGYDNYVKEITKLEIDQNLTLNIKMTQGGTMTSDVIVTAEKSAIINSNKTGAAQYVSQEDISNLPTMDRNIQDFARLSPSIVTGDNNGASVGGRNNRYNSIQIDGAIMNDAFGLSATGTPGGNADAQPISLDAIQEFQVSISPFDVRQGGFTGGSINAITRSGTNSYRGSAYYYGKNSSLVSSNPKEYPDFNDMTIGGRFGGPIIKDKLFFFANAEFRDREEPQNLVIDTIAQSGAINQFFINPKQLSDLRDTIKNKYGFDPGNYSPYTKNIGDVKLFARLDFNLSDLHRLTIRHNFVNASSPRAVDRFSTTFSYSGQEYFARSMQNQTVLQLNSILDVNMANELRLSYTRLNDERDYGNNAFPSISIGLMGTDLNTKVQFGVERSSQANKLDQTIIEFADNFSLFSGDHSFTFGTSNQFYSFDNLFIQDYMGSWSFKDLNSFYNGVATRLQYTFSKDPNNPSPSAKFSYLQFGLYAQDVWSVLPNLKLTYGLRFDMYAFPESPIDNPDFAADFVGMRTSELPSPVSLSPRVGFNWDVNDDKELQLRGGLGMFAGNTPGVWISNQFTNSGMIFSSVNLTSDIPTFDPTNWKNLRNQVSAIAKSEIAITNKDFKMPQVFRSNIAVDYHIGFGIIGTLELMYGKNVNEVMYKNLNMEYAVDDEGNQMRTIDGRNVYSNPYYNPKSNKFANVIEMSNTNKGYQFSFSAQLQKGFNEGVLPNMSFNVAYSTMRAKDLNSSTNSVALSNWQFNPTSDPNNPSLVTSNFQIDHRLMANVSYMYKWSEDIKTTIGLYYEGRSGSPFSFMFYTNSRSKYWDRNEKIKDVNNDNFWSNDVVYIPGILSATNGWSDDKMILVNGAEPDTLLKSGKTYGELFEDFIGQFDQAERGKVSERNQFRSSWRHTLDLKITQAFSVFDRRMEISLDIMNVLNLLNSDWGKSEYVLYGTSSLLEFVGFETPNDPNSRIKAAYYPNAKGNSKEVLYQQSDLMSRWRMQFGVRIFF